MSASADAAPPQQHGVSPRARRLVALIGVILLIVAATAIVVIEIVRHHQHAKRHDALAAVQARGPRVVVGKVKVMQLARTITLPGDVRGFNQATLYAKLSGYVREVKVERGDRVTRGQILATIESPESQKDVLTAQHDAQLMKRNAERAANLAPTGVVTVQDFDTAVVQSRVAKSNLARARVILDYTIVRAPFDGTVTARYVDPGALVPAATGGTQSALPIVDIADVETLRIFVYVGQDLATFVHAGDKVTIWQDELPQKRIPATVTRVAGALDPRTRTMQVEIDLDNRKWGLLPGTFAHVELHTDEPGSAVVPDDAIVIRDGKTMVALVEKGNPDGSRAHYVPVDLGYNDGRGVRVLRGLQGGETIALDVPVEVDEGDPLQPVQQKQAAGGENGAAQSQKNGAPKSGAQQDKK